MGSETTQFSRTFCERPEWVLNLHMTVELAKYWVHDYKTGIPHCTVQNNLLSVTTRSGSYTLYSTVQLAISDHKSGIPHQTTVQLTMNDHKTTSDSTVQLATNDHKSWIPLCKRHSLQAKQKNKEDVPHQHSLFVYDCLYVSCLTFIGRVVRQLPILR